MRKIRAIIPPHATYTLFTRVLPGCAFGGIILMLPGGVFDGVLENGLKNQPIYWAKEKPPEPLKQRPWEQVELIARFELATSSLPSSPARIFLLFSRSITEEKTNAS